MWREGGREGERGREGGGRGGGRGERGREGGRPGDKARDVLLVYMHTLSMTAPGPSPVCDRVCQSHSQSPDPSRYTT